MNHGGGFQIKGLILGIAIIGLLIPSIADAATLQELLRQQNDLKTKQEQAAKKINQLENEEAKTQQALDQVEVSLSTTQSRIAATESEISLANQVVAKLNEEIDSQTKQLTNLQNRLRVAYVALYELSRTSSTQRLAQGDTVSDIVSQEMYVQAIQDQLQKDITKSNTILADLGSKKAEGEKQKTELDGLKTRLAADKSHLDRQRSQKERYLVATQRDQVKYEEDLRKLVAQQESVSEEIYEARRRLSSGSQVATGGSGGYNLFPCGRVDKWLFYTCQCTSFAASKFLQNTGLVFYNTRPGQGSAWNWPALARDQGYTVSTSPRVGDIVSWPRQYPNMEYGHVAIVTAVHSSTSIDVEEYNWVIREGYSRRYKINPYAYGNPSYIRP